MSSDPGRGRPPRFGVADRPIPSEAPRAPTEEEWAALAEAERDRVVERLMDSVSDEEEAERDAMAEGDPHLDAKVGGRDMLRTFFGRIGRSLYVGADIKVFYPGEKGFVPDLIAVRDAVQSRRRSWMVSREGKGVDLALEVFDQSEWRKDYVRNVEKYARLGIEEYFILDIRRQCHLTGYRLPSPASRAYEPIRPVEGRYASQVLGLDLAVDDDQLRFYYGSAVLLGLSELLTMEHARTEAEHARAEAEQARAEAEQARAEAEHTRAEAEQARANEATAGLVRALFQILHLRGLVATDEQTERIRGEPDPRVLDRWTARAASVSTVEELLRDG